MRPLKANLLALSLTMALALGVAAGGGGSSDLLSGTTASEINSNLDQVPELVAEGNCAGAEQAVTSISAQVDDLEGVDDELKEALSDAALRLREVVSGCEEAPEENEDLEEPEETEESEEKPEKHEKAEKSEKTEPEDEGGQGNGNGPPAEPPGQEKKEETEPPPTESENSSGGVGPGAPVGGEG